MRVGEIVIYRVSDTETVFRDGHTPHPVAGVEADSLEEV